MLIVQIIALVFVSIIFIGVVAFLVSLWKKWVREMERNQAYQLDYIINNERIRNRSQDNNNL
jgi:hypothetical protein